MKTLLRAVLLLSSAVILGCATTATTTTSPATAASNPLQGSWELVSGRYVRADGTVTEFKSPQLRSLKVISANRFSFITTREDGTFVRAAGGRVRVDGNRYVETIDATSASHMKGDYEFTFRLDGDTWYHEGMHEGQRFEEVWRRTR